MAARRMRRGRERARFGAALLVLSLTAAVAVAAQVRQAEPPNEYQVKAAFLYNFAKFIEWPARSFADASTPIVIGIAGRDPFGDRLVEITRGERVNGRAIEIRAFGPGEPIRGCHVLFIAVADRRKLQQVLAQVQGKSVLTVSDTDDFASIGGMIGLAKDDYRIGLEINLQAAEQAGVKISSRLLSLAKIVDPTAREPWP